jgi:SAM-dependent methyltransferase
MAADRAHPSPLPAAGRFQVGNEVRRRGSVAVHVTACRMGVFLCLAVGSGAVPGLARQRPARTPDIYFAPTRHVVADAMLKLARVRPGDIVYDLGSGDGRILILAAQKYGARGVGVELDPRLVEISRQVAREGEVAQRVTFIEGDLFTADISEATVVTLYLSPSVNRELEPKLRRELQPGTRIVSHQFRIGTWAPDEVIRAEDGTDLFLWTIPAR